MPPQAPAAVVLHRFDAPAFVRATLLRRYKRFLADVHLLTDHPSGGGASAAAATAPEPETTTVHCPNTGPMIGLLEHLPAPARLSVSTNTARKYAHTLEMIRRGGADGGGDSNADGASTPKPTNPPCWVGVRSALANNLAAEMIAKGLLDEALGGPFERVEREVAYGGGGGNANGGGKKANAAAPSSRVDFVLHRASDISPRTLHLEVKSVTLAEGDLPGLGPPPPLDGDDNDDTSSPDKKGGGVVGIFPDTVSERASRHMRELAAVAQRSSSSGSNGDDGNDESAPPPPPPAAACLFVVQRGDVGAVAPAWRLDRAYGEAVREAASAGVALVAARCRVEPDGEGGEDESGGGGAILFDGLVPVLVERGAKAAEAAEAATGRKRAKKK
jgi:DNA-binding sugar fermentation-stimulating protein